MTSPPSEGPGRSDSSGTGEPADGGQQPEEPFNPYRFGPPDVPPPPEYAPPGYIPPPPPPPVAPPQVAGPPVPQQPGGFGGYAPYPGSPYPQPGQFGPPPGPYPPPFPTQYPPPRTGNGRATAALVLGIASIVLFFFSFLDAIPVALAFIFGGLGLRDSARSGSGRGVAIAAMICAGVGAAFAIAWTVVLFTRLQPCMSLNRGSSAFNSCVQNRL